MPFDLSHETAVCVCEGIGGYATHTAGTVATDASFFVVVSSPFLKTLHPSVGGIVLPSWLHEPVEGQDE